MLLCAALLWRDYLQPQWAPCITQNCQPLRFGRSLLRPRALRCAATLMIISLRSPSEKQFFFIFDPMRSCGHQIRQQAVVHVPFCVWDVGCATANRRSRFNHLTYRSVWFNSRFYASLPGETTSVFNHFKLPCRSEKLKQAPGWWISPKKTHTKFFGKSIIHYSFCALYDQHRAPSMWSAVPASSVLGTFLSPMAECTTLNNSKRHINKGTAIGSTLKISH